MSSPGDASTFVVQHRPRGPLGRATDRLVGYHELAPPVRRELPGGRVHVIVSLGPRLRIEGGGETVERRSFVVGLHDVASITTPLDGSCGVQLSLSPARAARLFEVPLDLLHNRCVALDDLLGARARELESRLGAEPDWATRFAELERFLGAQLLRTRPLDPDLDWLVHQLEQSHGAIAIGELTETLGWSRKRMVAACRRVAGVAPKHFARLLRFEHAVEALRAGGAPVDVALDCGFADQAHLCRDVRAFAGVTVTQLLAG